MALLFGNVENTDFVYSVSSGVAGALTISLPSLSSGDLILILFHIDSNTDISTLAPVPTDFADEFSTTLNGTGLALYSKTSDGTETSITITLTSGTYSLDAIAMKITGHNSTTPILIFSNTSPGGGSNWSSPSIDTTGVDGCLLFFGGGANETSDWLAGDEPDTSTLVYQNAANSTAWMGLAFETQATGGVTGTRLWTNAANAKHAFSFAVQPAAGGVTTPLFYHHLQTQGIT